MSTAEITPYVAPEGVSLVDIRMDSQRFPRLKALLAPTAVRQLSAVIAMAYVYTGRPADEGKIRLLAGALHTELLADKRGLGTANITVDEVAHAVKDAILNADGDVFINLAFIYRAVCNYAQGAGNDAQQEAYRRTVAARQQALDRSPVGAMLTTYAGRMLNNTTQPHNTEKK